MRGLLLPAGTLENLTARAVWGLGAQSSTFSRDPTGEANPLGQRRTKPTLQLAGMAAGPSGFTGYSKGQCQAKGSEPAGEGPNAQPGC